MDSHRMALGHLTSRILLFPLVHRSPRRARQAVPKARHPSAPLCSSPPPPSWRSCRWCMPPSLRTDRNPNHLQPPAGVQGRGRQHPAAQLLGRERGESGPGCCGRRRVCSFTDGAHVGVSASPSTSVHSPPDSEAKPCPPNPCFGRFSDALRRRRPTCPPRRCRRRQ